MSTQENLYKSLITKLICKKASSAEEMKTRLCNFYNHSEFYYDVFCDTVYALMMSNSAQVVSFDDFGRAHMDAVDDGSIGYGVLIKSDIVQSEEDIIVYIDVALQRLQSRLEDNVQQPLLRRPSGYRTIKLSEVL